MSSDKRKLLRTQGKYSSPRQSLENVKKECSEERNNEREVKNSCDKDSDERMMQDNNETGNMSSDKRKQLRTQGMYYSPRQSLENVRTECSEERNNEREVKNSFDKESDERMMQDNNETEKLFTGLQQGPMKLTYEENCPYTATAFDPPKRAEEIKERGLKILSKTDSGESRIYYYPVFLQLIEGYNFYDTLAEKIEWRQPNILIHGREYRQPRQIAWFGPFPYAYSGVVLDAQEMPDDVLQIKRKMEKFLAEQNIHATFNSVLLNKYRSGSDSVAWHSDDELSMGIEPTIASVSLGAVRKFEMRRKPTEVGSNPPVEYFVNMKSGSLLIMDGVMQLDWQHRVPKEVDKAPRINLTFRTVYKDKRLLKAKK